DTDATQQLLQLHHGDTARSRLERGAETVEVPPRNVRLSGPDALERVAVDGDGHAVDGEHDARLVQPRERDVAGLGRAGDAHHEQRGEVQEAEHAQVGRELQLLESTPPDDGFESLWEARFLVSEGLLAPGGEDRCGRGAGACAEVDTGQELS